MCTLKFVIVAEPHEQASSFLWLHDCRVYTAVFSRRMEYIPCLHVQGGVLMCTYSEKKVGVILQKKVDAIDYICSTVDE